MSDNPEQQPTPDYKYFELYYYVGKRWARQHLDELTELCFGKTADAEAFTLLARQGFEQTGLGNMLSAQAEHPKYRSDKELAESRFVAGVYDVAKEEAQQRGWTIDR